MRRAGKRKTGISKGWLALLCVAIVFVAGALVENYLYVIGNASLRTWADRGAFGDAFGAAGALFSGLAFTMIVFTIVLQTRELSLQREAIQQARQELATNSAAQKAAMLTQQSLNRLVALSGAVDAYHALASRAEFFDDTRRMEWTNAIKRLAKELETEIEILTLRGEQPTS